MLAPLPVTVPTPIVAQADAGIQSSRSQARWVHRVVAGVVVSVELPVVTVDEHGTITVPIDD